MSSTKWPEPLGPDAEFVMVEAVAAVAERSFYAVADRCDAQRFAQLARDTPRWTVATIAFADAETAGDVVCTLSEELAVALFNGFTGREPLGPPPACELLDMVGEFANMVCGAWLTRRSGHSAFSLSPPAVKWAEDGRGPAPQEPCVLLTLNDLPLAVEVRVSAPVTADSGV